MILLVVSCVALFIALFPSLVSAGEPVDMDEAYAFSLINQERTANGLPPVTYEWSLQSLGYWKAYDMAANGYFSHIDLSGRNVGNRAKEAGVDYAWLGENLGMQKPVSTRQNVLRDLHGGLLASTPHRSIMLNPRAKSVGIGIYVSGDTMYYVETYRDR